jgi:predicted dehydrogenase
MERVKVGFVRAGRMGQMAHLRNYVALAELVEETRLEVARRYAVPRSYRSATEMLAHEELDCIVASQPFTRHGILLRELVAAGVPVFTEKPLASSVRTGERIVDLFSKSEAFLMLGYHKRSDPAVMRAKEEIDALLADGSLGGMRYVRIVMPGGDWIAGGFDGLVTSQAKPTLDFDEPDPEMSEDELLRYTKFVNFYIHQVNMMRHLIGAPYRPVFADQAGVLLVMEAQNGVTGTLEMSPYRTTIDWQEEILVCFEHGWLKIELPAPLALNQAGTLSIYRDPGASAVRAGSGAGDAESTGDRFRGPRFEQPTLPKVHAMKQQAKNFLAAVRGERPAMTDAAEALDDLEVARECLRLMAARRNGTPA